jgi:hypothetical protein
VREIIPSIADKIETVCRELIATGKPRLNVEMIAESVAQSDDTDTLASQIFSTGNSC